MPSIAQTDVRNRLLSLMSSDDFALLEPHLQRTIHPRGDLLIEPNQQVSAVHFMETGIASQIAITPEHTSLEVGIYGREGMGPTSVVLGVDRTPCRHIVQVAGDGFIIEVSAFQAALRQSVTLHQFLMRYVQVATVQTAYTAVSNGSEVLGERLARWLLMCHDRLDGDDLSITHEFLGVMLGVRRSGVTDAVHIFEGIRMVRATRGRIRIVDRERLEDTAGGSYGVPEAEYERLIGPLRAPA